MNFATKMKTGKFAKVALLLLPLSVIWISGCAGPPGGLVPLLGPPFDQLASFILFGGLLLGALLWFGKSNRG